MVSRFTRAPPLLTPSLGIVVFSLYVKAHECLAVTSFNSEIEKTKVLICSLTSWRIYRYCVQVMTGSRVSWFPGPGLFPCGSVFSVTYQGPDSAKSHLLSSSTCSPTSGPSDSQALLWVPVFGRFSDGGMSVGGCHSEATGTTWWHISLSLLSALWYRCDFLDKYHGPVPCGFQKSLEL